MIEGNLIKNEINFPSDMWKSFIALVLGNFKFVCTQATWQPSFPTGSIVEVCGKITNTSTKDLQISRCLLNDSNGCISRLSYTTQPVLSSLGVLLPGEIVDVIMHFVLPLRPETIDSDRYGAANCKLILIDNFNKSKKISIECQGLV